MSFYRIRNIIIAAVMLIAAFIIQSTIFSRIPLIGCAPDLILILTFIFGYSKGKISGMLMGFFGGLLIDVFFCEVIGYHALVLLIIGFLSGIWNSFLYSDDLYVPLLLMTLSELLYCGLYFFFWYILQSRFHFSYYLLHTLLPEFLLTFIAEVILYKPVTLLIAKLSIVPESQD